MKLSEYISSRKDYTLEYGALWAYSPYGTGKDDQLSRSYKTAVKQDESVEVKGTQVPMSEIVAQIVKETRDDLPFGNLFDGNPTLVPVRSTSLMKPDSLWVPLRIATSMERNGLGQVSACLERKYPLQRAATSSSGGRPTAAQQYDSLEVQKGLLSDPSSIVLIDDVVTTGATLIASSKRLREAFPDAKVTAFAAIRTVTRPETFKGIDNPVFDEITLYPSGKTHRNPN